MTPELGQCNSSPVKNTVSWVISHLPAVLNASVVGSVSPELRSTLLAQLANLTGSLTPSTLENSRAWLGNVTHAARLLARVEGGETLRILVVGGSVTFGANCAQPLYTAKLGGSHAYIRDQQCAWPARLQSLVNTLFGRQAIDVESMAFGGYTSSTAVQDILRPRRWPARWHPHGPDIIIHAFATNDMNPAFGKRTQQDSSAGRRLQGAGRHMLARLQSHGTPTAEFERRRRDGLESFIRTVLSRCDHPLLIIFDDYLGNEWNVLEHELSGHSLLAHSAQHYGLFFTSYADMVRRWVLEHPAEGLLSPMWWYSNTVRQKRKPKHSPVLYGRQVHPGWQAHTAMAWSLAYNMILWYAAVCNHQQWTAHRAAADAPRRALWLPPPLFNVSTQFDQLHWRECRADSGPDCSMHWSAMQAGADLPAEMAPFLLSSVGWTYDQQHKKWGWRPMQRRAPLRLSFSGKGSALSILFMRSYGEEWGTMRVEIALDGAPSPAIVDRLPGYGAKNVSISVTATYRLPPAPIGPILHGIPDRDRRNVTVTMMLETGGKWKLQGMSMCDE